MFTQLTFKNIIMILMMICLIGFMTIWGDEWLHGNYPSLYPFRSVSYGIAIGLGLLLNAVPGQTGDTDDSAAVRIATFLGAVAFTFCFFGLAEMIRLNHPQWFIPFRVLVLGLISAGWLAMLKYR